VIAASVAVPAAGCTRSTDAAGPAPTSAPAPTTTTSTTTTTTTPPTTTTTSPPPIPRWTMFGDSGALSLALVWGSWETAAGETQGVGGVMELGCGIVRGGQRRYAGLETIHPVCDRWPETWAAVLDDVRPDVALVTSCQWETVDRKLEGDTMWRSPGDPVYDARVRDEYLAAADLLASRGSLVLWLTCAPFGHHPDDAVDVDARRSHERARADRLNQIIGEVASARPDSVRVVDLAAWMEPRLFDTAIRADGSHYALGPGDDVVRTFLGPALVSTWQDWWRTHRAGSPTG
jgi:hypothetical protein